MDWLSNERQRYLPIATIQDWDGRINPIEEPEESPLTSIEDPDESPLTSIEESDVENVVHMDDMPDGVYVRGDVQDENGNCGRDEGSQGCGQTSYPIKDILNRQDLDKISDEESEREDEMDNDDEDIYAQYGMTASETGEDSILSDQKRMLILIC